MFRSAVQTISFALGFTIAGWILTVMLMNNQVNATAQESGSAAPLRHVVLFKFKADATKEQIEEIVAGFQALPKKIEGITAFEWGTNNSPEGLADGFTHCFVVTFDNAKSRDAYLPHQAHKDFVAILLPRLDKVLVVDYFARK
jgi:hypothetical protein